MLVASILLDCVSVAKLFMAGFIPGIILSLGLMVALAVIAKRHNYPQTGHVMVIIVQRDLIGGALFFLP